MPELVLDAGNLFNKRTRRSDLYAFSDAFGISEDTAANLTNGDASHKTPLKAAKAVELVAVEFAEANGYEIVPA